MFDFWKKRDNSDSNVDEFGEFDNFDFDDFGFDSEPVKDDRSPITKAATGFASGTLGAFKDADISDSVERALPENYKEVFEVKNQIKDTYKEIADQVVKDFEPLKSDLKKIGEKVVKGSEKFLPEKVYQKLSDLVKNDSFSYHAQDKEARERAAVQAELAGIFDIQNKAQEEREERREKKEEFRSMVSHQQHQDTFSQLDAIRRASISVAEYHDNILLKYQRKDLENTLKQTNILLRIAEETSAFRAESKSTLDIIAKNSGLPDFVKQLGSERLHAAASQRFFDKTLDYVFHGNNFIANFLRESKEGAKNWISNFASSFGSALSTGSHMSDSMDAMDDLDIPGMKISKLEMAASGIGGVAGNWLRDKTFSKLRDYISGDKEIKGLGKFPWAEQVKQGGWQAQMILSNLPYYINQWIREKERNAGVITGKGLDILDDLISRATREGRKTLDEIRSLDKLHEPALFTNRVSRSISEIIPGYLSKILREVTILRTGDTSTPELLYDFQTNRFASKTSIANEFIKRNLPKQASNAFIHQANYALEEIDKTKTLSPKENQEIAKILSKSIGKRNIRFDKAYLTNPDTYKELGPERAEHVANLMADYLRNDNGEKVIGLIRKYSKITSGFDNLGGISQMMMDAGYRDVFREMNFIDDNNVINNDMLFDYITNNRKEITLSEEDNDQLNPNLSRTPKPVSVQPTVQSVVASFDPQMKELAVKRNDYLDQMLKQMQECCDKNDRQTYMTQMREKMSSLDNTSKDILEAINNLKAIQVLTQVPSENQYSSSVLGYLDKTVSKLRDKHGSLLNIPFKAASWFGQKYGSYLGMITKGAVDVAGFAGKGIDTITGKASEITTQVKGKFKAMDVYLKDHTIPILRKHLMEAGEYFNEDGTVIKKFNDIKSSVYDRAGNLILTAEEFKDAHLGNIKEGFFAKLSDLTGNLTSLSATATAKIGGAYINLLGLYWKGAVWTKDRLLGQDTSIPQDVYLKGKDTPVLTRLGMIRDYYIDENTASFVNKVSDITGSVIDTDGNYVLTEDEFRKGLYDKHGKPFKGLLRNVWNTSKRLGRRTLDIALSTLQKGKETLMSWFSKDNLNQLKNKTKEGLSSIPNIILASNREVVSVLNKIYGLLNHRLPGKKILGDRDNDGDVDNSVSDIIQQHKEERLNKIRQKQETNQKTDPDKVDKERPKGVFGLIWDVLKNAGTMVAGIIGGGLLAAGSAVGSGISSALTTGIGGLAGLLGLKRLAKGATSTAASAGGVLSKIAKVAKGGVKGALAYMLGSNILDNVKEGDYGIAAMQTAASGYLGLSAIDSLRNAVSGTNATHLASTATSGTLKSAGFMSKVGTGALGIGKGLGLLGKGANFLTLGLGSKLFSKGAAKAFLPIDLLMSGYGLHEGIKTGNRDEQIEATGSLGGAGLGALVGTFFGGPIGTAAGAAIGSFVGWVGGMATNAARKYFKKGKLSPMEEIRFVQYGFNPKDEKDRKKIDKIMSIERILEKALVENGYRYELDPSKIDVQALLEVTGIDPKDVIRMQVLHQYIQERMGNVLVAWTMALRSLYPNKLLEYADRIDDIDKVKIITAIKALPDSTYSFTEGFFPDHIPLTMGPIQVRRYLEKTESDFKDLYIKETLDDKDGFFSRPWFESKEEYAIRKEKEKEELKNSLDNNQALSVIKDNVKGASESNLINREMIAYAGFDKDGFISPDGKVKLDAISAIRFITYGIRDFDDISKISQLRTLEERLSRYVTITEEGKAVFTDKDGRIFANNQRSLFGGISGRGFLKWMFKRVIPTYLKFRAVLSTLGVKTPDMNRIKALNPQQKVLLAQGILEAKDSRDDVSGKTHDKGDSVFDVSNSPWVNYTLSDNSSYARPYMNYLEYQAERSTKVEEEKLDEKPTGQLKINQVVDKSGFIKTSLDYTTSDGQKYRYNSYGERIDSNTSNIRTQTYQYSPSEISSTFNEYANVDYGSSIDQLNSIGNGGQTPTPGSEIPSPKVTAKTGNALLDEAMNAKLYAIGERKGKMRYGSDNKILNAFIGVESMGISDIKNPFGYVGLGQFKRPAWNDARRYVPGLLPWSEETAKDPGQGFAAIKGFMLANANYVKKSGIDMSDPVNLYLAHQQGAGGLQEIHKGLQTGRASARLRRNMDNNGMRGASPSQFYRYWQNRFYKNYETFANMGGAKYEKASNTQSVTADPFADMVTESQSINQPIDTITDNQNTQGFTPVVSTSSPIPTGASYFDSVSGNTDYGTNYATTTIQNNVITDIVSSNGKDEVRSLKTEAMGGSEKAKKAALYASKKALRSSTGWCARYVADALEYAGYVFTRQKSAYLYNTHVLPQLGFTKLPINTPYQIGDIIVYGKGKQGKHQHGHIQIFDGINWISDFRQKSIMIYNPKTSGEMTLWRDMSYQVKEETQTDKGSQDREMTTTTSHHENPVSISSQGDMVVSNDTTIQDAYSQQNMRNFESPPITRPTVTSNPVGDRYDRATVAQMREAENSRQMALIGEGLNVAKEHLTVSKEQLKIMMSIYQFLKENPQQSPTPTTYQEPRDFVASKSNEIKTTVDTLPVALGVSKAQV